MAKSLPFSVTVASILLLFVTVFMVGQRVVDANLFDDFAETLDSITLFQPEEPDTELLWSRERRKVDETDPEADPTTKKPKNKPTKDKMQKTVNSTKDLSVPDLYGNIKALFTQIKGFDKQFTDAKSGYAGNTEQIVVVIRDYAYRILYQMCATCLTTKDQNCKPCANRVTDFDPKNKEGCGDHSGNIPIKKDISN